MTVKDIHTSGCHSPAVKQLFKDDNGTATDDNKVEKLLVRTGKVWAAAECFAVSIFVFENGKKFVSVSTHFVISF